MIRCPINAGEVDHDHPDDGCGYRADTVGALAAHVRNKADDDHAAFEDYTEARRMAKEAQENQLASADPAGPMPDASNAAEVGPEPVDVEPDDRGKTRTMNTEPAEPVEVEPPEVEDPPEPEGCPQCGSVEFFDPERALIMNGVDPSNHPEIIAFDRACNDCSEGVDWFLYNAEEAT